MREQVYSEYIQNARKRKKMVLVSFIALCVIIILMLIFVLSTTASEDDPRTGGTEYSTAQYLIFGSCRFLFVTMIVLVFILILYIIHDKKQIQKEEPVLEI
jgi:uncharacterized BrkB/YihY/UPF0761 family membrane protein